MKRFITSLVCIITSAAAAHATVTLEIDCGFLRNATGTAAVPVGGLLQLIATPSGVVTGFAAPTSTSFTGGDNIIVASFAMNYKGGTGETDNLLTFTLGNTASPSLTTAFDTGDPLLLRWYPSLTYSAATDYTKVGPGLAVNYGQARSATAVDGGVAWNTPANGTSATVLTYITTDDGGSELLTSGYALNVTAVPEPSTDALVAGCLLGLALWRFRQRGCEQHG